MVTQQLRELGLSQTVEVFIDTNTITKFRFSDNLTNLDNALVHAISIGEASIGKSPSGKTILDAVNLSNTYLTLLGYKNEIYNDQFPFNVFRRNGSAFMFFKPKLISFRNSFIEVPDASALTIPAGGYAVLFTIFYENYDPAKHKFDINGELIEPED